MIRSSSWDLWINFYPKYKRRSNKRTWEGEALRERGCTDTRYQLNINLFKLVMSRIWCSFGLLVGPFRFTSSVNEHEKIGGWSSVHWLWWRHICEVYLACEMDLFSLILKQAGLDVEKTIFACVLYYCMNCSYRPEKYENSCWNHSSLQPRSFFTVL